MATLRRVPVTWTTGPGGTGASIFFTEDPDDATAALGTFFNAIKGLFPTYVSWSIPSSGDTLNDLSGHLVGSWSGGTSASITGTGGGASAAGTGMFVRWYTNTLVNNRKFIGRTFLAPVAVGAYASDGTLDSANQAAVQTAANALVAGSATVIWHRPPVGTFTGGTSALVTSALVPDRVTSLKSRRS